MLTARETFYCLIDQKITLEQKNRENMFFQLVYKWLDKTNEITLPMQLFEKIFKFDFHRGAKHPIASNVVRKFKDNGLKVSKVRNRYLVRIKPNK